jgi:hypothetical protein
MGVPGGRLLGLLRRKATPAPELIGLLRREATPAPPKPEPVGKPVVNAECLVSIPARTKAFTDMRLRVARAKDAGVGGRPSTFLALEEERIIKLLDAKNAARVKCRKEAQLKQRAFRLPPVTTEHQPPAKKKASKPLPLDHVSGAEGGSPWPHVPAEPASPPTTTRDWSSPDVSWSPPKEGQWRRNPSFVNPDAPWSTRGPPKHVRKFLDQGRAEVVPLLTIPLGSSHQKGPTVEETQKGEPSKYRSVAHPAHPWSINEITDQGVAYLSMTPDIGHIVEVLEDPSRGDESPPPLDPMITAYEDEETRSGDEVGLIIDTDEEEDLIGVPTGARG